MLCSTDKAIDKIKRQFCQCVCVVSIRLLFAEKLFAGLHFGLNSVGTGFPADGTDLSVNVSELESLHQTQRLVHITAHRQVIDCDLTQVLLVVDYEQPSQRNARVFQIHAVVLTHLSVLVGQQRDLHLAQTALFSRCVHPGQVTEVTVGRTGNDLAVSLTELIRSVAE